MRVAGMGWGMVALVLALALMVMVPGRARAQGAVAFAPTVGSVPDGVSLSATPVVSADRRYVRLGLSPGFQTINGFQNFPVPGVVGGGGFRSMMGGPINQAGFGNWYPDYFGMPQARYDPVPFRKPTPRASRAAKFKAAKKAARARKPLPDPVVMPIKKKAEPRG